MPQQIKNVLKNRNKYLCKLEKFYQSLIPLQSAEMPKKVSGSKKKQKEGAIKYNQLQVEKMLDSPYNHPHTVDYELQKPKNSFSLKDIVRNASDDEPQINSGRNELTTINATTSTQHLQPGIPAITQELQPKADFST